MEHLNLQLNGLECRCGQGAEAPYKCRRGSGPAVAFIVGHPGPTMVPSQRPQFTTQYRVISLLLCNDNNIRASSNWLFPSAFISSSAVVS